MASIASLSREEQRSQRRTTRKAAAATRRKCDRIEICAKLRDKAVRLRQPIATKHSCKRAVT